jgi:hypothetical protein
VARRSFSQRRAAALLEMARRSSATRGHDSAVDHDDDTTAARRPRRPQLAVTLPVEALSGILPPQPSLGDRHHKLLHHGIIRLEPRGSPARAGPPPRRHPHPPPLTPDLVGTDRV